MPWSRGIRRVDDAIGEGEKRRQRIAGKRREKEVKRNRPPWPLRHAWPRLNDGPPEQKPASKEACVFNGTPTRRLKGEFEERWDMPADEDQHRDCPAAGWIIECAASRTHGRPPE